MLEKCMSLICMALLFVLRNQSTRGFESSENTWVADGTEKVSLAGSESAKADLGTNRLNSSRAVSLADLEVGLADSGQALEAAGLGDWEVSLADSKQVAEAVGLADWKVSLADLE
jgi:hypothetical protein